MSRLALTLLLFSIVALFMLLAGQRPGQKEAFGTSPGTMVQLATSHVPTQQDVYFANEVLPRIVRRDLIRMTGGDPGPIRLATGGSLVLGV